jgi:AbrB family looped-hinge helix DNA binding protein
MIQMKVSDGGRVVIPSEIRQLMSIKEGDTVLWQMQDGVATLTTRLAQLKQAQAIVRKHVPAGVSLVDEVIADRRAENALSDAT